MIRFLRKITGVLFRIFLILVLVGTLVIVVFHLPPVQNRLAKIAGRMIKQQLNTPLVLGKLHVSLLDGITMKDLVITDRSGDTIIAVSEAAVDLRYIPLLRKELCFEQFRMDGFLVRLVRERADSTLNIARVVKDRGIDTTRTDTDGPSTFTLAVRSLDLSDGEFHYMDHVTGSRTAVALSRLDIRLEELDLPEKQVFAESVSLTGLKVEQVQATAAEADPPPEGPAPMDSVLFDIPWDIRIAVLNLEDNGLVIRSQTGNGGEGVFPAKELFRISGLNAVFSGLHLEGPLFRADLDSLRAVVGGFPVDRLAARLFLDAHNLSVDSLLAGSGRNRLEMEAGVTYNGFHRIRSDPGSVSVRLSLRAESPGGALAHFLPEERVPASLPVKDHPPVLLYGEVDGTLDLLNLNNLYLSAGDALNARIRAGAGNLTGEGDITLAIYLDSARLNTPALMSILPDTLVPASVSLPRAVDLQGSFNAGPDAASSKIHMWTSLGELHGSGTLTGKGPEGWSRWSARMESPGLDLGTLLDNRDTLGMIAFSAGAEGSFPVFGGPGTDALPDISALLDINTLELLGYTYDSIIIEAGTGNGGYFAMARIVDEHLDLRLAAIGRSISTDPRIDLELTLDRAELQELNLASEPTGLAMHGDVELWLADEQTPGRFLPQALEEHSLTDLLVGEVVLDGIRYRNADDRYGVDTVRLALEQLRDSLHGTLLVRNVKRNDTMLAESASIRARGKEDHIRLDYRADIAGSRSHLLAGPGIHGEGELILPGDSLVFTSHIAIRDSAALPDTAHYRLFFSSLAPRAGSRQLDARLRGERMGIAATALLEEVDGRQELNGRVDIDSLDLGLLGPLATGLVDTIGGELSGSLSASGTTTDPKLEGRFLFRQVSFTPSLLNSAFLLEQEEVGFSDSRVIFDSVAISDRRGNRALLEGWIDVASGAYPAMDLSLEARQFRLMDKPLASGGFYYGTVVADLDADVAGSFAAPQVSLLAAFNNESRFSFIVPPASVPSGEGIYEFESPEDEQSGPPGGAELPDNAGPEASSDSLLRGVDPGRFELETRVHVTDSLQLSIVTNPVTGEELQIRGDGNLSFGIDQGGGMSLSGRYTIASGIYRLKLFEVIRRDFTIREGSYLEWTGEIMQPDVELTTVYSLRTSGRELLATMPAGLRTDESYGSIPVEVIMKLTGPLLSPAVEFDISTGEQFSGTAVESALARLKQSESELNKQAFSLLVFGSFMSGGPVSGDPMAYELRNQARQSLSQLLTGQMNRFAGQYIKGVDLEVGIESYGETGSEEVEARTEVSLGLTKRFLDDRLTLEVGGSVALEESGGQEVDATDLAGDFAVEYMLTPAGTYRVRAFNSTERENEIDGEVTTTGVSLIFRRDFTSFRELIGKKQKGEEGP